MKNFKINVFSGSTKIFTLEVYDEELIFNNINNVYFGLFKIEQKRYNIIKNKLYKSASHLSSYNDIIDILSSSVIKCDNINKYILWTFEYGINKDIIMNGEKIIDEAIDDYSFIGLNLYDDNFNYEIITIDGNCKNKNDYNISCSINKNSNLTIKEFINGITNKLIEIENIGYLTINLLNFKNISDEDVDIILDFVKNNYEKVNEYNIKASKEITQKILSRKFKLNK